MAIASMRGIYHLARQAGGASLAVLATTPAFAQDTPATAPIDDGIVVTGIRASLERAAESNPNPDGRSPVT